MENMDEQLSKKRVYFKLTEPKAKSVALVGTFNTWDKTSLKQDKNGVWRTWKMMEPGTYEYRYLDGEWQNEPDAELVVNPYGTQNCLKVVR